MKLRMILASILLFSPFAKAADIVRTGGDSLICMPRVASDKYPGFQMYVLDYVLAFPDNLKLLAPAADLKASLDRIESLLVKNSSVHLASFQEFRQSIGPNGPVSTANRVWTPSDDPLQEIPDGFPNAVPDFCSTPPDFFKTYWQTVIRQRDDRKPGVITYTYDRQLMLSYYHTTFQRQASILLIHEWLWDFYDLQPLGAVSVRTANAFLHSLQADSASSAEFDQNVFHAPAKASP